MANVPQWVDELGDRLYAQIVREILPPYYVRGDLPPRLAVIGEECFLILTVTPLAHAEVTDINQALSTRGLTATDPSCPNIRPAVAKTKFFASWERHMRVTDRALWEGRVAHEDFCEKILLVEGGRKRTPALTLVPLTRRVFNHVLPLGDRVEDGADFVVLRPREYPDLQLVVMHPPLQASTGTEE